MHDPVRQAVRAEYARGRGEAPPRPAPPQVDSLSNQEAVKLADGADAERDRFDGILEKTQREAVRSQMLGGLVLNPWFQIRISSESPPSSVPMVSGASGEGVARCGLDHRWTDAALGSGPAPRPAARKGRQRGVWGGAGVARPPRPL